MKEYKGEDAGKSDDDPGEKTLTKESGRRDIASRKKKKNGTGRNNVFILCAWLNVSPRFLFRNAWRGEERKRKKQRD